MSKSLKCAGYVAAGIGIIGGGLFAIALFAVALGLFSDASAQFFGLSRNPFGLVFFLGYVAVIGGVIVGVSVCREESANV